VRCGKGLGTRLAFGTVARYILAMIITDTDRINVVIDRINAHAESGSPSHDLCHAGKASELARSACGNPHRGG
jgi:hypothetical protein